MDTAIDAIRKKRFQAQKASHGQGIKNSLVCPNCGQAVFFRKSYIRKGQTVRATYVHYQGTSCNTKVAEVKAKEAEKSSCGSQGQYLELFCKSFVERITGEANMSHPKQLQKVAESFLREIQRKIKRSKLERTLKEFLGGETGKKACTDLLIIVLGGIAVIRATSLKIPYKKYLKKRYKELLRIDGSVVLETLEVYLNRILELHNKE
ncbi:MAG: hypothetical protein ACK421_07695 [Pseudanabaenaceae cyanobacterium]